MTKMAVFQWKYQKNEQKNIEMQKQKNKIDLNLLDKWMIYNIK